MKSTVLSETDSIKQLVDGYFQPAVIRLFR